MAEIQQEAQEQLNQFRRVRGDAEAELVKPAAQEELEAQKINAEAARARGGTERGGAKSA